MLTNAQIVTLALQTAKCPGFTSQANLLYNAVLRQLFLNRDLKMLRATQTINVTAGSNGPFTLESDYLRTYDLFYLIPSPSFTQGEPVFLNPITMEEFDAEYKDPSVANYPYEFSTDLSVQARTASGSKGYLYIYPQSSGAIPLTHRYMQEQPDIATPSTDNNAPWFPNDEYLFKALAAKLMAITDDDRRESFEQDCERILSPYLIMEGDEQKTVHAVRLDPRRFRISRTLRPVKTNPF